MYLAHACARALVGRVAGLPLAQKLGGEEANLKEHVHGYRQDRHPTDIGRRMPVDDPFNEARHDEGQNEHVTAVAS